MKISAEYNEVDTDLLAVQSATFIGDYVISLIFNDGTEKLVDFKSFLEKSSHPSIRKYLEESTFRQFAIIDGNLNWNDYDLIFPIYDLYQGSI